MAGGALIGEAFLSASIQALCHKLASGELMDLFRGRKLDNSLMEKLKMTLLTLRALLNDAEKQIVNPAVGMWLDELKHAIFDADDLLDEIDTRALQHQTKKTQVWKFISTSDILGLREGVGGNVSHRTLTTPCVEHECCTYGRVGDKEKLETLLLSDDLVRSNNISVTNHHSWDGRVGKTTLAQLLYNDDEVKEYFDIETWACVSEDFDAIRGKKFLFVLDDLWNDNYNDWDLLRAPFTYGERGSKLSDEDCRLLLERHAFRNENPSAHLDLEAIGKKISQQCNGLPLAAKPLGGLF
ncbi:unnamed protein product [Prunus armeniaca]